MEKVMPLSGTTSQLVKDRAGKLVGLVVNSHTNGVFTLRDGLTNNATAVKATAILTMSGAVVPAAYSNGTLTSTGTAVSVGDTVGIGAIVYTAVDIFSENPYEVYRGSTANGADFLLNLSKAVNETGEVGVDYSEGTVANSTVFASTPTATELKVYARTIGAAGNSIPSTETSSQLSWSASRLANGADTDTANIYIAGIQYVAMSELSETIGYTAIPYEVKWVTNNATFLDNFKHAVNGTGTPGTDYSTGTEINTSVSATTNTATEQTVEALVGGESGNYISVSTGLANTLWSSNTLLGGVNSTITMFNSYTLGATEKYVDLHNVSFDKGLYIDVAGTLDYTLLYI